MARQTPRSGSAARADTQPRTLRTNSQKGASPSRTGARPAIPRRRGSDSGRAGIRDQWARRTTLTGLARAVGRVALRWLRDSGIGLAGYRRSTWRPAGCNVIPDRGRPCGDQEDEQDEEESIHREHPPPVPHPGPARRGCRRGRLPPRAANTAGAPPAASAPTPGAPPTFGTAPAVGPEVSPATFAEAEKLVQVTMTPAEREMAAESWRKSLAPLLERRTGPRKVALEPDRSRRPRAGIPCSPASGAGPARDRFVRAAERSGAAARRRRRHRLRAASTQLSRWIEPRKLTSERLTSIYLDRIERFDPEAPLRHHPHQGPRARAGEAGRRRDRRGQVSRPAARHSVRGARICSTPRASRPPTAPSRSGTACPTADAAVVRAAATTRARCSSPSSASARSRSTTSGSAARR